MSEDQEDEKEEEKGGKAARFIRALSGTSSGRLLRLYYVAAKPQGAFCAAST